jgi:hypothetical protein
LNVHLHHFSKIRSQKKSQNSRNQGFSLLFLIGDRRIRIRIRIQEAQKPTDRDSDPDPQNWFVASF